MNDDQTQQTTPSQQRGIRNTLIGIALFIALVLALFLNKMLTPHILTKDELRAQGVVLFDSPRIVKPFQLEDHNKRLFDLESLRGKLNLVYFGFTHCPDICPTTIAELALVMKSVDVDSKENIAITLITVDPARDTAAILKDYIEYFDPNFTGVTGEFRQVLSLSRNLNVAFNKVITDSGYTMDHTGHIVLIDKRGNYIGFIKPPFDKNRLVQVLSTLVALYVL